MPEPVRVLDFPVAPALGYLVLDVVDDAAHVEQVSVDPAAARQGIGRALLGHAARWAVGEGFRALTLTAYLDVPWNGPYYERLGFRRLPDATYRNEPTSLWSRARKALPTAAATAAATAA